MTRPAQPDPAKQRVPAHRGDARSGDTATSCKHGNSHRERRDRNLSTAARQRVSGPDKHCTRTTATIAAYETKRQAAVDFEASMTDRLIQITTAFAVATISAAAAASLASGGRIHRDLNRPYPHDASAVKLRTLMAQLRPLPGRFLLQRVTIGYSVYKRSELGDHRGARQ